MGILEVQWLILGPEKIDRLKVEERRLNKKAREKGILANISKNKKFASHKEESRVIRNRCVHCQLKQSSISNMLKNPNAL